MESSGGQLAFAFRTRGGARKGAGRKPRAERRGLLPHLERAEHVAAEPVHVTARAVGGAPYLRTERVVVALRAIFARASAKGFRLVHFSVQGNHLHLIVEASSGAALARGVQRLLSRVAMTVNAIARRSGKLWRDRHHRVPLTTPSQVRNAFVYVLFNFRKHESANGNASAHTLLGHDLFSSSPWFDGFAEGSEPRPALLEHVGPPVVVPPWTWLARKGWRDHGLVGLEESPRS